MIKDGEVDASLIKIINWSVISYRKSVFTFLCIEATINNVKAYTCTVFITVHNNSWQNNNNQNTYSTPYFNLNY